MVTARAREHSYGGRRLRRERDRDPLGPLSRSIGRVDDPQQSTSTSRPLSYQPALDGIRALAVLSVMAYHAGWDRAHAGFLGVDVFLVLSGFLITYLLILEIRSTGSVNRRRFWSRRARRLLPALFAVLIAVGVYAMLVATPADRAQIRGDAIASLFYVQNWHLIASGQSYFAQFGTPSPLQHMWSLAVEEQWYIVWPLLFLALVRLTRGNLTKLAAITAGLAVASASLMIALYRPGADPSRVYYGTDTRAQALLVGAALAFLWAALPPALPAWARRMLQVLALAGGAWLAFTIDTSSYQSASLFRGGFSIAAIATAAVIAAAMVPGPVRSALGVAPLAKVGMISYGLYLWHWPIFLVLTPDRTGLLGWHLALVRFTVTFAVAVASYVLLERPIRRGRWSWTERSLHWAPAGAVLVAGCLLVGTSSSFAVNRSTASSAQSLQGLTTGDYTKLKKIAAKENPPLPGATRVVIAGDSVAFALPFFGVPKDLRSQAWVQGAAIIGCGIGDGDAVSAGVLEKTPPACSRWPQIYANAVKVAKPDVSVLLIGAWEVFDRVVDGHTVTFGSEASKLRLLSQLDRARRILTANGGPLVLLTTPCFSTQRQDLGAWGEQERTEPWRVDWLNSVFRQFAGQHPDDVVIGDLDKVLCPGGKYTADLDGKRVRSDGVHLTEAGSALTYRWLIPFVRKLVREHP